MYSKLTTLIMFGFLSIFSTQASQLNAFNKRFEFVKKDGKLLLVRDRSIKKDFSIGVLVNFIKDTLLQEKFRKSSYFSYRDELSDLLDEDLSRKSMSTNEELSNVADGLDELRRVDFKKVFANPKFKSVLKEFDVKLKEILLRFDPTIIAHVQNPRYFYNREVTQKVLGWGLNFAKKRLSSIPLLNTASFIMIESTRMFRERLAFHQNMLMHYLENFNEKDLGLTHDEVNMVFSSVYESKIPWFAFWESKNAEADWLKYGVNKFFTNIRTGNARMRDNRANYVEIGEKINFAFQRATLANGDKAIINLYDTQNMFKPTPAVAYYLQDESKVLRTRVLLKISELGVSFLPLPDFLKQIANNYSKSFYSNQQLTEGALVAHFESTGDKVFMNSIFRQYLNPFDGIKLK